ncbi:MOP flippase family protein [Salegentibacter agarivorans]
MMSFKQQLFSGVIWTTIEMAINRSFKFIIKLILARILFPEDYGIIGMTVVFTSIISVFSEMGMGAALIQRKEDKLSKEHFDTAFWTGILWGILIYLIVVFFVGPFAADFYGEPIISEIIPILSLGILINPINAIHKAKLIRSLSFKKISIINNSSTIVAGVVSLILALSGAGVWALVFDAVVIFFVATPQWFYATKWFPSIKFSKKAFSEIFGFGLFTTGTQLFGKVNSQVDYLIVGKIVGATALGYYSLAFLLTSIARTQITQIVDQVIYPIFSKLQDEPEQLKRYYLKILRANTFVIYPIMLGIILFSEYAIPILFGDKWVEAIPIVQILSIGVIISMTTSSFHVLMRASGKPDLELKLSGIFSIVFFIPLIVGGTLLYGIEGTAWGYVIALLCSTFLNLFLMLKIYKIKLRETFGALILPFTITIIPFLVTYFILMTGLPWFIMVFIYAMLLLLLMYFFAKKEINEIRSIFLSRKVL